MIIKAENALDAISKAYKSMNPNVVAVACWEYQEFTIFGSGKLREAGGFLVVSKNGTKRATYYEARS